MSRRKWVWWPVAATVVPMCLLFDGVSASGGYFLPLTAAFVAWFAVAVV